MKPAFKTFILLGLIVAIAACFVAYNRSENIDPVNKTSDGLALRGFDAVAYFAADSAVKGDPKYEYAWNGAKWLFSSAENLDKFKADPAAYAPQFGGYCAYAVSHGYTADGDPQAWKVVDGKLYLNYNQKAKEAWEKEQDKFIKDGQKNWIEFQTKKPEHKN